MTWEELKDSVYDVDGALRDIYVCNTTKEDWQIWADFVNNNYPAKFYNYETEVAESKIDLTRILKYWNGEYEYCSMASIYLGNIIINTFFFQEEEIENDITPTEINSMDDHYMLIKYMSGLSKALNKKVILTPEGYDDPKLILISVFNDEVKININRD